LITYQYNTDLADLADHQKDIMVLDFAFKVNINNELAESILSQKNWDLPASLLAAKEMGCRFSMTDDGECRDSQIAGTGK